jgi:hypothetical protein
LCDGPAAPSFEQYAYNAFQERMVPGEGELPVAEFLTALPPHVIFGLEVPLRSMAEQGVGHLERAQLLMRATRAVMARAETMLPPERGARDGTCANGVRRSAVPDSKAGVVTDCQMSSAATEQRGLPSGEPREP